MVNIKKKSTNNIPKNMEKTTKPKIVIKKKSKTHVNTKDIPNKINAKALEKSKPKKSKTGNTIVNPKKLNKKSELKSAGVEGNKTEKTKTPEECPYDKKVVYVGNVPLSLNKQAIKNFFTKYGKVGNIWFRSIPLATPKGNLVEAIQYKRFHPQRKSASCYIRFSNEEEARKATEANGQLFDGFHLRVSVCTDFDFEDDKAIFVGNLPFDTEDEELWQLFQPCGKISSVRVIRDRATKMGKGFAYVNFADMDGVSMALEMTNVKLRNRELRISESTGKNDKRKKSPISSQRTNGAEKFKTTKQKKKQKNTNNKNNAGFQGRTVTQKKIKKKHISKDVKEKKKIAKILTGKK